MLLNIPLITLRDHFPVYFRGFPVSAHLTENKWVVNNLLLALNDMLRREFNHLNLV